MESLPAIYSTDYKYTKLLIQDKFNKRDLPRTTPLLFKVHESSGIVPEYLSHYTIKYNKPRKSVDVGKQLTGSLEAREPRDCAKRSTNHKKKRENGKEKKNGNCEKKNQSFEDEIM